VSAGTQCSGQIWQGQCAGGSENGEKCYSGRQASRRQGTWDEFKAEEDGRLSPGFATQLTPTLPAVAPAPALLDRPVPAHASVSGLGHI